MSEKIKKAAPVQLQLQLRQSFVILSVEHHLSYSK